ncbi:MAG: cation diffusion facilitator family transporter [Polyangiaceae bacterium]
MAGGGGDPKKVVMAALLANGGIAIAKFVAAWLSGSVAMVAEGVHSVADTSNQALLLVGMGLAAKRDPVRFPMGRAAEQYFWAFVVSLMLFFLGGVYALYEGIHKLMQPDSAPGSLIAPVVVLGISILLEGKSFLVAIKEFNHQRGDRPIKEALFRGRDPVIPVVLLEDAGALFGLVIALIAVGVSWATGSTIADGVGSVVIGLLLCSIGVVLAYETHGLIIGEGITPEHRRTALELARSTDGVEDVTQLLSLHLGPDSAILALKVKFPHGITVEEVEAITDAVEERIREKLPHMKRIFIEPDSDYDPDKDPELAPVTNGKASAEATEP